MGLLTGMRFPLRAVAVSGVFIVGIVLAGALWPQAVARTRSGDESLEYRVKAAYLLNFTRYVEWPTGPTGSDSVLSICVLGADPFGRILDATVAGRTAHGRSLRVRRFQSATEAAGCEVVFVSSETWRRSPESLKSLQRAGSLTVGESEQFARVGGVIGFVILDQTVRFVVNDEARSRAGLRISSRMLALAAAIYGRGGL